jgi:hypothetical protein
LLWIIFQIDGDATENQNPQQHLDEGEFIEVMTFPLSTLCQELKDLQEKHNCGIDGKLWLLGSALTSLSAFFPKSEQTLIK